MPSGAAITAAGLHTTPAGLGPEYSLDLNNTSTVTSPTISGTPRFLHFCLRPQTPTVPNNESILFRKTAGVTASVSFRATGLIEVSRGTSTTHASNTVLATSTTPINRNVGHWIAIELDALDAAGTFTVWVDGIQMVTFSGDTKGHASTAGWDSFDPKQVPTDDDCYISDIVVTDNTTGRLSERHTQVIRPTSVDSGNFTGVAVTGANRYQNIDEAPASQTDYNYGAAINDEDLYGFEDLPFSFASIDAAVVWGEAITAGLITGGQLSYKRSGATSYGATNAIGAAYEAWFHLLETDPDTGSAWTEANLEAGLFGAKAT